MALIDGTPGNDILAGTPLDDVINGLAGNDTITGDAGNDTINGGTGVDTMSGGEGDDTFIADRVLSGDVFDGGNGTDTIELRVVAPPVITSTGPLATYIFTLNAPQIAPILSSIEKLRFASSASQGVFAQLSQAQIASSGIAELEGGAGRDFLTIVVPAIAGSYAMPDFVLTNWSALPLNAWEFSGDAINLAVPANVNVTLTASETLQAFQGLAGGAGNDILNGSSKADSLNGNGGVNQLFGFGGNDSLAITNQSASLPPLPGGILNFAPPTTFTGAGSIFDGGEGTDVLSIGGYVEFLGSLLSIEGIEFRPAFTPVGPGLAKQDAAVLEIGSAQLAMLPANSFFTGTGMVIANIADGTNFDGSQFTFTAGSNVRFEIRGGAGDGVSLTGTSTSDTIRFGTDIQTATGGGGADLFHPNPVSGTGTVTDFTLGEDKIELDNSGFTGMERLNDFLGQGATGARIAGDSGGTHREIVLQGIAATSLSASDFVFDPGGRFVFDSGTAFDDVLFGFGLNDLLSGGDGNDRIYTGGGRDTVSAGIGNDTVVIDGQIAFGSIFDGGTGSDTLLLRPSAITLFGTEPIVSFASSTLSGFETVRFDTVAGGSRLFLIVTPAQAAGIANAIGGAGTDFFIVAANGVPGNVYTIPTLNLINWGADDLVSLSATGNPNGVTLNSIAHTGTYVLAGSANNDILNGSSGIEGLLGREGDDTIFSGGGADFIDGGIGTDTAVFAGLRSTYTVAAGLNGEVLVGTARVANVEAFLFNDGKYIWDGTQLVPDNHPPVANADTVSVNEDAAASGNLLANDSTGETNPAATDTIALVSVGGQAIGAGLAIQGSYGTLSIGTDGAWSYTADADLLDALQPGLTLTESFDYTIADSFGVTASSALTVNVSTIADVVTINLGNGDDRFTASAADELINGGRGNDILNGLAGSDRLYGGNGEDRLFGGDGWDLMVGGLGEDRLDGGNGNDVLIGGRADDLLFGGAGADTFEFGNFSGVRDRIGDFELGVDFIHLSDGVTITGASSSGVNTTLALSSGGSIQLMGIAGINDIAALLTPELPHWTDGLLLA